MKLLAFGDAHLGAGETLGLRPGERLAEHEQVFEWCLEQAREHSVDAILFAGDLWQHRRPSPEQVLAAERPLVRHRALGGPPVISIVGNHCISSLDGACAQDVLHEAGLIRLEREPRVVNVDGCCLVACLPWAPTSRLAARVDVPADDVNSAAAQLLLEVARTLYEDAARESKADMPIVLLTHFSISGTSLPSGLPVDQLREPVLDQDDLLDIGFDYVIAGHIHRPQRIGLDGVYVGSPMQLNFGEADGLTRGPWLVTFEQFGTAEVVEEQLAAPSRRFVTIDYGADHHDDLWIDRATGEQDVAGAFVKLRVRGTQEKIAKLDLAGYRAALEDDGAHRVFVETVVERESRARDRSVDDTLNEREALERWMAAQNGAVDHETAARALERAQGYLHRVLS